METITKSRLLEKFFQTYYSAAEPVRVYFAPGRVNLIGEHTDYNGGLVLPCALTFGTWLAVRPNKDNQFHFQTVNFNRPGSVRISSSYSKINREWYNYPLGVVNEFLKKNVIIGGLDMLFWGDIPPAAGLSSSASIEMVTAVALNDIFKAGFSMMDLILLTRRAENQFIGVNCGIMDMYSVGMGQSGKAVLIDCTTLEHQLVPLNLPEHSLVIGNTNKKRGLADSKYNERVAECSTALGVLQQEHELRSLSDLNINDLDWMTSRIADPVILKRARHVVTENHRVRAAVEELSGNNLSAFGNLMNQSHESLRIDYEVTGFELDTMTDIARSMEGVLGSRMTGAGFGGCTVSLVNKDAVDQFIAKVSEGYWRKTGLKPDFYVAEPGPGAGLIQ